MDSVSDAGEDVGRRAQAVAALKGGKSAAAVQGALAALGGQVDAGLYPELARLLGYFAQDGAKRDPGGYTRVALLRAIQPWATRRELPLLLDLAETYEFAPGRAEIGGQLRAHALSVMDDVNPELASFHAVRLLVDEHTSRMSGEPAVTAVRVLTGRGQTLPLYLYACGSEETVVPEVLAECLKHLAAIPTPLLIRLVEQYGGSRDDAVLVGVVDLVLAAEPTEETGDWLEGMLRSGAGPEVWRYAVTTIIAERKAEWLPLLVAVARAERRQPRLDALLEILPLARGMPEAEALLGELRGRRR